MIRKESKNGVFSTKHLFSILELGRSIPFPLKIIWNSQVLTKVSFFTWEANWGKFWLCINSKKECSCGQIDIFFEKSKGNQLITFFFTVSNILFIQSSLGYSLHGYRNFIKLVWLLCSKKTKEGLEGCSPMHILDVRKETDKRLKAKRCRIKSWNVSS